MLKVIVIFVFAFVALCQALPVEESKREKAAVDVPLEKSDKINVPTEEKSDLSPDASTWWTYYRRGNGWERNYYGYGPGYYSNGYGGWGFGPGYQYGF